MSMFDTSPVETGIEEAAAYVAGASGSTPTPADLLGSERPTPNLSQGAQSSETLIAAESYIRAGWKIFPGKRGHHDQRDKQPKAGWKWTNKAPLTSTDAWTYFGKDQHNVLVVLGKDSGNLTDIDLDWPEAAAAADVIFKDLPSFGRSGKPRSHRLAICDVKTLKYLLPQS